MEYRFLGRSGLRVSELCLGTMMFGEMGTGPNDDGLSRKHILDAVRARPSEGTRVKRESEDGSIPWDGYATERTWRVVDEVAAIAAETGRTAAQVSLRWLIQREPVTAPIVGGRTLEQAKDNLAAAQWSLTAEQMDRLTAASAPGTVPYPYDVLERLSRR